MFNITVNLRKCLKRISIFCLIIFIGFFVIKYCTNLFGKVFNLINIEYSKIISSEISISNYKNIDFKKGFQKILKSELITVSSNFDVDNKVENITEEVDKDDNNISKENNDSEQAVENNTNIVNNQIDFNNLKTEVISEKNLKETYNAEYNGVKIKNESNYTLSEDILKPDIEFSNKKDILIFHTHTCESYTQTKENSYIESGNFRTTDLNYTVSKVGDELTKNLINKNFNVIHDTTYHDYPAYTGSYTRSLLTVKGILEKNPGIQTIIDLHRDAVGSQSSYGPAVKIGEERVAQIMFVIGTDGGGLEHPNWKNNLKYAIKIQQKANELFPGLFRPIIVRNSRYNQNLSDGACIIEVGATGNTLEECIGSMKYLAEVLSEVMK